MTRPSLTDPAQRRTTRLVLSFLLVTVAVVIIVLVLIFGPDIAQAYAHGLQDVVTSWDDASTPLDPAQVGLFGIWIGRLVSFAFFGWLILYFSTLFRPFF